jgi:hypothetical protein
VTPTATAPGTLAHATHTVNAQFVGAASSFAYTKEWMHIEQLTDLAILPIGANRRGKIARSCSPRAWQRSLQRRTGATSRGVIRAPTVWVTAGAVIRAGSGAGVRAAYGRGGERAGFCRTG